MFIYKTTNPATPKITKPNTLPIPPSTPTFAAAPVTTGNNPDVVAVPPPNPPLGLAVAVVIVTPTSVVAVNVAVADAVAVAERLEAIECCSLRILEIYALFTALESTDAVLVVAGTVVVVSVLRVVVAWIVVVPSAAAEEEEEEGMTVVVVVVMPDESTVVLSRVVVVLGLGHAGSTRVVERMSVRAMDVES